jgi:hypothetical protein
MRAKFGWDANRPRPILIHRIQLQPGDLPPGYTIEVSTFDKRVFKASLKGPQGALQYDARESHNYAEIDQIKKEMDSKPGDVLLFNYAAIVHISGPGETAWPALDHLEAALRRKMRMGPATIDEYTLERLLPPKCQLLERRDLGFPVNPRLMKTPAAVQLGLRELWAADLSGAARGWAAVVSPGETQVYLFQAADGVKAADLAARLRKAAAASKQLSVRERESIVAVIRSERPEDAEFKAVDGVLREKLRAK